MIIGIWQRVIRDTRQPLASGKESSSVCTFFALNLRADVAFSYRLRTAIVDIVETLWPSSSSSLLPIDSRYLYLPLSNLFPYSLSFLFDFAIDVYDATILLFFLLLLLPFFFPPLLRDAVTKGRHLKPCFKEGKKATRIKIDGDKGFDGF